MPNIYDEFSKWLKSDEQRFCDEVMGNTDLYIKIRYNDEIDLIYCFHRTVYGEVIAGEDLEYQGLYYRPRGKLYDVQYKLHYRLRNFAELERGCETERVGFEKYVRERVEQIVSQYSDSIAVDDEARKRFERYECSIDESARKIYLNETDTDLSYKCEYSAEQFEKYFIKYLIDREKIIRSVAEEYYEKHKDEIRDDIIFNILTKERLELYKQGKDKQIEIVKKIIASIPQDCKTVNVTTVIDGKELTFKTEASELRRDCKSTYSTWYIKTPDREDYERLYRRCSGYKPEDITRITFSRKTLYEREATDNA